MKLQTVLLFLILVAGCGQSVSDDTKHAPTSDSLFVTITGYDSTENQARDTALVNLFCTTNLPNGTRLIIFRTTGEESVIQAPFELSDTITITQKDFVTTISRSMIYGYLLFKIDESLLTDTLATQIKNSVAVYAPAKDPFFNCEDLFCSYWHIYPTSDIRKSQRDNSQNAIWINTTR